MRRRELVVAGGVATATALAGCVGSAQEPTDGEPSDRTITVRQSGTADGEPNLAVLQLGVEVTGDDADSVRNELSERTAAVESALLEAGLEADAITTGRFRIRERYDRQRMRREGVEPESEAEAEEYRIYEGTHNLTVEVEEIDRAGEIVDIAVDAGADDIGRIEFTLSDERREELQERALEEALDNARLEADTIATEIGATVVQPIHVDTAGGDLTPIRETLEMDEAMDDSAGPRPEEDAASEPGTQLNPDDVRVSASVTVQYEIS